VEGVRAGFNMEGKVRRAQDTRRSRPQWEGEEVTIGLLDLPSSQLSSAF